MTGRSEPSRPPAALVVPLGLVAGATLGLFVGLFADALPLGIILGAAGQGDAARPPVVAPCAPHHQVRTVLTEAAGW